MKKFLLFASLAALIGLVASSQPAPRNALAADSGSGAAGAQAPKFVQANAKSATLRVKFIYDGKPPAPEMINTNNRDAFCGAIPIASDKLIVGKDGSLKNVALMFDESKSKVDVPAAAKEVPEAKHKLDNEGCMFEPRVLFVRSGQTIEVVNSDQTAHNANFSFFKNPPVNVLVPIGGSKDIVLNKNEIEPAPIPVECNIHPWMLAHVIVLDHPYVGISGEDGVVEITDLPVGEVTFRAWHTSGKIDEVVVDGKKQKWGRGNLKITLKPGINDLGEVRIAADKFK